MFHRLVLVVAIPLLLALPSCGPKNSVSVTGSTSMQKEIQECATTFHGQNPDINVQVQATGSGPGLQSLAKNATDIAMCSRSLTDDEQAAMKPITVAIDGIAIIVNPSNPVNNLTVEQVQAIFSGETKSWKDVGGPDQSINLISREEGSGTREAFTHLVMKKKMVPSSAATQNSSGAVRKMVSSTPGAIGYISLGLVSSEVKALNINGIAATDPNILNKTYLLWRPFLLVVRKNETLRPQAQKFIDFVLSPAGQDIMAKGGLIKVSQEAPLETKTPSASSAPAATTPGASGN